MNWGSFDLPPIYTDQAYNRTPVRGLQAPRGYVSMLTALLEELSVSIQAQAIALVSYNPVSSEIRIELGGGYWSHGKDPCFFVDRSSSNLVRSSGIFSLHEGTSSNFIPPDHLLKGGIRTIYHYPLFIGGQSTSAIWAGYQTEMPKREFPVLDQVRTILANNLFAARLERGLGQDAGDSIQTLLKRLAAWDIPTLNHSMHQLPWVKATALKLGCSQVEIRSFCWATLLHDLGKMIVPRRILQKPGPLDEAEWAVIKLHPGVGARMVSATTNFKGVAELIETHHEKFDGSGYPNGIVGDSIPFGARILSVVDAYSAMTEERTYRKIYSHTEAVEEIMACAGSHFDPQVCKAFIEQF